MLTRQTVSTLVLSSRQTSAHDTRHDARHRKPFTLRGGIHYTHLCFSYAARNFERRVEREEVTDEGRALFDSALSWSYVAPLFTIVCRAPSERLFHSSAHTRGVGRSLNGTFVATTQDPGVVELLPMLIRSIRPWPLFQTPIALSRRLCSSRSTPTPRRQMRDGTRLWMR